MRSTYIWRFVACFAGALIRVLLEGLHEDYQPEGVYEEWLVVKIAECMWRLRRATRCESGAVRESVIWAYRPDNDPLIAAFGAEIGILTEAEQQLQDSGNLSKRTYDRVAPLVEKEKEKRFQSEKEDEWVAMDFDRQHFLTCITERREFVDSLSRGCGASKHASPMHVLTTRHWHPKLIWKGSCVTRRGFTGSSIGQYSDS